MKLVFSLLLPQLAGLIGSYFATQSISTWYTALNKPSFSPPNWLFGPVWLILYLMMGIAVYLNWIKKTDKAKYNVRIFFIHLFLNFIWAPVFFGLKNLMLAYMIIALIWAMIVIIIDSFWEVDKISSLLLFPYLIWVAFASLLNYFIWQLN